jgi:ubiquinone/menaquinone biosynthesis C-methylase UbiE
VALGYDEWFETPLGRVVDRLEKRLIYHLAEPERGESVLDLGTGTGHYAMDLARHGLHVVGYDRSEAMLEVARGKKSSVTWRQGDAASLPFEDAHFALVLSVTMLEFVDDPSAVLDEMWRVTAPGGRMVVAVLNNNSPWAAMYQSEAQGAETPFRHAHFFMPQEFVDLLSRYGEPRWSSSVFVPPSGRGLRLAGALESLGQTLMRTHGALLVGRVDK